ncbi:YkgJ family cysteine cluster protein [Ectothiorhodospiraceae bacterium BW-2]|nr:YkgJ family cysteine cluster protein [Ectothiorhodospiraceae bacterium BW-2]
MSKSHVDISVNDSPFSESPVVPTLLARDKKISFRCYKGVKCFNACCSNIDITLTPYDIIRLKNRLDVDSGQFLQEYTVPFEFEKDGIAGVKMKPVEGGTACRFMTEEGCSVYEDRPTACRYYPVGMVSMRKQDEYTDSNAYALVEEEHCLGHQEDRTLTIDEYREEQGLFDYDEYSRGWRQLILKKKSSGATIGKPSLRSRQLFFMACYNIDQFRTFVASDGFQQSFDIEEERMANILLDDVALMLFGFDFLKHVLFGEEQIKLKEGVMEQRLAKDRAILEQRINQKVAERNVDADIEPFDLS